MKLLKMFQEWSPPCPHYTKDGLYCIRQRPVGGGCVEGPHRTTSGEAAQAWNAMVLELRPGAMNGIEWTADELRELPMLHKALDAELKVCEPAYRVWLGADDEVLIETRANGEWKITRSYYA